VIGAGVADAVRATGKTGQIVIVATLGISTETESLIQSGDITVTAAYPAVKVGKWADVMVNYLNGDKNLPKRIPLPVENIDKSNIDSIDLSKFRAPKGYSPGL
jgi:ribose transport system substrate-binding protein